METMLLNGEKLSNSEDKKMGETWTKFGFANFEEYEKTGTIKPADKAKINFGSESATVTMVEFLLENPSAIKYALNAGNKQKYDFKTSQGSEGTLLFGKYASGRDVGNFAAGIVKARSNFGPGLIQYGYGLYNYCGNSKKRAIGMYIYGLSLLYGPNPNDYIQHVIDMQNGEDKLTQMAIDVGYNYIKKK